MCNFRAAAIYLLIHLWAHWPGSIKLVIKNSVWLWRCLFSVAACKLCSLSLLYFYWRDGSCLLLLVTVSSCSPQAWMLKSLLQLHLKLSWPIRGYQYGLLMPKPLTAFDILNPKGQFLLSQNRGLLKSKYLSWMERPATSLGLTLLLKKRAEFYYILFSAFSAQSSSCWQSTIWFTANLAENKPCISYLQLHS